MMGEKKGRTVSKTKNVSPPHVVAIIDKSGSMAPLTQDTIGGYNTWLAATKQEIPDGMLTRVLFDGTVNVAKPVLVTEAAELNPNTYVPGGSTALYDAIKDGLATIPKTEEGGKALVLIVTDGEENASYRTDADEVHTLIRMAGERGVTFSYLSAHPEGFSHANRLGIARGNVALVTADAAGTRSAYRAMATATAQWSASAATGPMSSLYAGQDDPNLTKAPPGKAEAAYPPRTKKDR